MVNHGGSKNVESGRSDIFSHLFDMSVIGTAKEL